MIEVGYFAWFMLFFFTAIIAAIAGFIFASIYCKIANSKGSEYYTYMAFIGISIILGYNLFAFLDLKFVTWTESYFWGTVILSVFSLLLSLFVDKALLNGV